MKEIPKGTYCYDKNGLCPYWKRIETEPEQMNGYCDYLKIGDWEVPRHFDLDKHSGSCYIRSILWLGTISNWFNWLKTLRGNHENSTRFC
jgi:hypothetical protein